jgi:hypothetical protein
VCVSWPAGTQECGTGTKLLNRKSQRQRRAEIGGGAEPNRDPVPRYRRRTDFGRRVNFTRRVKKSYPARRARIFWNKGTLPAGHYLTGAALQAMGTTRAVGTELNPCNATDLRRNLSQVREALELQDERLVRMKDMLFRAEREFLRGWVAYRFLMSGAKRSDSLRIKSSADASLF